LVAHPMRALAVDEHRRAAFGCGPRVRAATGAVDPRVVHAQSWPPVHVHIRRALNRRTSRRVRARRATVRIKRHIRLVSKPSLSRHPVPSLSVARCIGATKYQLCRCDVKRRWGRCIVRRPAPKNLYTATFERPAVSFAIFVTRFSASILACSFGYYCCRDECIDPVASSDHRAIRRGSTGSEHQPSCNATKHTYFLRPPCLLVSDFDYGHINCADRHWPAVV
jgi:hypothetical protein